MKVYNTYTKQLEEFKPQEPNKVRMYNCGPTVYSSPHIGNFRSFLFADVLRRYLEFRGFEVLQIMNLTDVGHLTEDDIEAGEDKMEAAARREKLDPWKIAEKYANEFFAYVDKLNVRKAMKYPRATDHIAEMIDLIQRLIDKGFAYVVNGNVYFDITKFADYGKLSGNPLEKLEAGARIEVNPEKKNPGDFALWKRDPKHLMQWDSPWGRGFPGWHIECSAMSMKYLGETLDIHTGGEDNIFPHHESEIAQSEAANGKPFVRYWMHARHLLVDGRKMSKSEGNFYTVQQVLDKGYDPMVLRYQLLSSHYRTTLNFTFEGMEASRSAVERLRELKRKLMTALKSGKSGRDGELPKLNKAAVDGFTASMDEDLNMAQGLSHVFEYVRAVNRRMDRLSADDAQAALETLLKLDSVIGVLEREELKTLDAEEEGLVKKREEARKTRDWATADKIRAELRNRGVLLEDTKQGTRWRKL